MALEIVIKGVNQSGAALTEAATGIDRVGASAERSHGFLRGLASGIGSVVSVGATLAGGTLVAGLAAGATAGFSFNNAMEQATAKLNAMTKDGAITAQMLDSIRTEAAKTPFAFEEMVNAFAGLLPAAKSNGVAIEDLVKQAEILAASNPAQGLEGATIALKGALSGDYTSIIERFDLPREYINQLKAEGVPALDIVSRSMKQMGYDIDLVSGLANTASGRWSTFTDTLTTLAGRVTQPIFQMFSDGLGQAQGVLDGMTPTLNALADSLGAGLAQGIQQVGQGFQVLVAAGQPLIAFAQSVIQAFSTDGLSGALMTLGAGVAQVNPLWGALIQALAPVGDVITTVVTTIGGLIAVVADAGVTSIEFGEALDGIVPGLGGVLGAITDSVASFRAWASEATSAGGFVSEAIRAASAVVQSILTTLAGFWEANGASIMAFVATTWTQISGIIQTGTQLIYTVVSTVLSAVAGFINDNQSTIQLILSTTWTAISTIITTALNLIQGIISAGLAIMRGDFSSAWSTIQAASAAFVEGLWSAISGTWNSIMTLTAQLGDTLMGLASTAMDAALSVGSAVVDGIRKGIESGWSALTSWVGGLARSLLDSAKAALGISSPSREFETDVGAPIVQGIREGLDREWPDLLTNVRQQTETIARTASESVQRVFERTDTAPSREAGRSIIDGVRRGIEDAKTPLIAQVGKLAEDLLGGMKRSLDIASPSGAFEEQVGVPIAQGIERGIERGMEPVVERGASAAQELIDTMHREIERRTSQPIRADLPVVITPVVERGEGIIPNTPLTGPSRARPIDPNQAFIDMREYTGVMRTSPTGGARGVAPSAPSAPVVPSTSANTIYLSVDARQSENAAGVQAAVDTGVQAALRALGVQADVRLRMGRLPSR